MSDLFQVEPDMTDYEPRDARGRLPGDERLTVRFAVAPVQSVPETEAQGRPIFQDREFIYIKTPGDQHCVIETMVTDAYRKRFPLDYQRFKEGLSETLVGTPLTEFPAISPAQVKELKALDIHTVEVLAELSDEITRRYAGFATLKAKAGAFLKSVNDSGFALKQQAELEKRDALIAEMQAQLAQLVAAQAAQSAPKKATKAE